VHWLDFNKGILILEMHGTSIKKKKIITDILNYYKQRFEMKFQLKIARVFHPVGTITFTLSWRMTYKLYSYREKPNKMQQCIKVLLFLILNEAQHVGKYGDFIFRQFL
jgi:hypothetical protein